MDIKSRKFNFRDRHLEVRSAPEKFGWRVKVFEGSKPVISHSYTLAYETEFSGQMQGYENLLENLMDLAQSDIEDGITHIDNN